MSYQDETTPDDIEQQIEATRHQLGDTLEQLHTRLSPGDLFNEAVTYAKSHREFGTNLATTVRQNPIPFTLLGVGLGWLIMRGGSGPRRHSGSGLTTRRNRAPSHGTGSSYGTESSYRAARTYGTAPGHDEVPDTAFGPGDPRLADHPEGPHPTDDSSHTGGHLKQKMSDLKAKASQAAHRARDKIHDSAERLHEGSTRLQEKATSTQRKLAETSSRHQQHRENPMNERYQNARDKGSYMARNLQEGYHQRTHELRHRAHTLVEERPLAIVAMGFGIGAMLGLLMPSTNREDRMMGHTRDHLKDRAMEEGEQQFERAREQVSQTAEAVSERMKQEARSHSESAGAESGGSKSTGSESTSVAGSAGTAGTQAGGAGTGSSESPVAAGRAKVPGHPGVTGSPGQPGSSPGNGRTTRPG